MRIGAWVLRRGVPAGRPWRRELAADAPLPVNVNLAARQLALEALPERVRPRARRDADSTPSDLALEVTETALMDVRRGARADRGRPAQALGSTARHRRLRHGLLSLSYLRSFPIDTIKIDRSFVAERRRAPGGLAIVEAIVDMGHALGLRVVAEGIETEAQAREVERLGCDLGQGFLFARPVPAADLAPGRHVGHQVPPIA